jgi:hypothetical protein
MSKFIWRGIEDNASEMTMFGREWLANVAQDASEIKNIEQEITEKLTLADGSTRTIPVKILVSETDMLRTNPCFDEVGEPPKEHKKWKKPARIANAAEEMPGRWGVEE